MTRSQIPALYVSRFAIFFQTLPWHKLLLVRKAIIGTILPAVLLSLCCLACNRVLEHATVKTISTTDAITISDVRFHSPAIAGVLSYRIIVPALRGDERLPVLYLLHGANSGPAEVMERAGVAQLAAAEHLAVVIPDGRYSYYTNAKHQRNARWEDAITGDLMDDVRTRFPVLVGRGHTGIAGISMGGYGAAELSLKHPDLYGFTGIMSGALDITRRPASLRRIGQTWRIWTIFGFRRSTRRDGDVFDTLGNSTQLPQTTWFISCGGIDPLHDAGERFAHQIRQHGMKANLITTQGGHGWQSWNAAMPQMFRSAGNALR
jgi:S-formylglutathione hydrolase FrmB